MNLFTDLRKLMTLLLWLCLSTAGAQDLERLGPEAAGFSAERLSRLTTRFQEYIDDQELPGTVTLIARNGKVVYYEALGYQDIEGKKPMKKDALFRIASQTKAIVSVGIMMLQEEGRLLIQDEVSKYIPEFSETTVAEPDGKGGYTVTKAKRQITLRDLLTHTAGIGYGGGPAKEAWAKAEMQGWYFAHRDEPIEQTIRRMAQLPMDAHPGEKFVYGYATDILGVVIEKASGMPLDQFLQKRIFQPLGMNDTHFFLPKEKVARLTKVYTPTKGAPLQAAPEQGTMSSQGMHYISGPRKSFSGGAGLISTARDYYLFLQMMANGGALNGQRLLSNRTVELMTIDHLNGIPFGAGEGFGLGFEVVTDTGKRGMPGSVGQYGWGGAYGSTYWVDPAEKLVVVYFTQLRPGSIVPDQLTLRALVYQALVD